MDITSLLNEIQEDLKVDEFNLKDKQLKLPAIKHKYAGLLIRSRIELNELLSKKEQTKKSLVNSIIDKSPVKISQITAEKTAEDSNSLKAIETEIKNKELQITLLEKTEKTLASMTYDIKNIIDIIKLETT